MEIASTEVVAEEGIAARIDLTIECEYMGMGRDSRMELLFAGSVDIECQCLGTSVSESVLQRLQRRRESQPKLTLIVRQLLSTIGNYRFVSWHKESGATHIYALEAEE